MQRSPRPGKPTSLSDSINRRLNMYALAAGAAGVGVLALTQQAEAKIVYTKVHVVIGGQFMSQIYDLDLYQNGVTNFSLSYYDAGCSALGCFRFLSVDAPPGNSMILAGRFVGALAEGAQIGPRQQFTHFSCCVKMVSAGTTSHGYFAKGPWVNVKNRYLGLKFHVNGEAHYGWARLDVSFNHVWADGGPLRAILTGYAYETVPNKAIIAGKTKGPDEITVEPDTVMGSLGILALGRK